jgi:hypothetical protein
MFTKTSKRAEGVPPRDKALLASDTRFRILADTTASAMFTCWGEQLMLRMADRDLYRMKRRGRNTVRSEGTDRFASIC